MFRRFTGRSLAAFVLGAGALLSASMAAIGPAEAFSARYDQGYGAPGYGVPGYGVPGYGWRPPPPAVHGYWGQRRWQRYNHEFGHREPPPRARYGYGYGWR